MDSVENGRCGARLADVQAVVANAMDRSIENAK